MGVGIIELSSKAYCVFLVFFLEMLRQEKSLNDSTLREELVLYLVSNRIFDEAKKLYSVVLRLIFTFVAVVTLLVSAIVVAVFSRGQED